MKKIVFLFTAWVAIVLVIFLIGLPHTQAKTQKTQPQIFVLYEAKPGRCSVTTNDQLNIFGAAGWRLKSGLTDYKINYSTKPANWSNDQAKSVLELAFSTVQGGGGGDLFHYAGESTERKVDQDGQNTIMWQTLPGGIGAMTYIWHENGRLVDADTIFNKRYSWVNTSYTGRNDCGGSLKSFDLRNIATHEFGHWVGLGDVYDPKAKDLTMYGYASRGELKKQTLGLGDITGIRSLWP